MSGPIAIGALAGLLAVGLVQWVPVWMGWAV